MNKRIFYLLITLIGLVSLSLVGHFSAHNSYGSVTQHKVHPTYKPSFNTFNCIDESEIDTDTDFDSFDTQHNHSYEISCLDYSIHYEDYKSNQFPSQNYSGNLYNGIPIYITVGNFRI